LEASEAKKAHPDREIKKTKNTKRNLYLVLSLAIAHLLGQKAWRIQNM
jgi:hypothetical protein